MDGLNFLVVEDDPDQLKDLISIIRTAGHQCLGTNLLADALSLLGKEVFTHVITDIHLNNPRDQESEDELKGGFRLLTEIKFNHPNIAAIAISSDPKIETFNKALSCGAQQFLRKPVASWDDIAIAANLATKQNRLVKHFNSNSNRCDRLIPRHLIEKYPDGIVLSPQIRKLVKIVAGFKEIPLTIVGETGTGKEEVAKLLHRERVLAEKGEQIPFVAVNCAHLESNLAQSKLFGHIKGSFTGANSTVKGFIGEANGGILFLDEVHHLTFETQKMLLRVLNDGSYHRIGDVKEHKSHFQVVIASTQDLDRLVSEGRLLEDIRARVLGQDIVLPPLRERLDELQDLIELYFAREGIDIPSTAINGIVETCKKYYWQGNIRTLHSVLRNMTIDAMINDSSLTADLISERPSMLPPDNTNTSSNSGKCLNHIELLMEGIVNDKRSLKDTVDEVEYKLIKSIIAKSPNIGEAAKMMKLGRATLDNKRKKYGL